MAESRMLSNTPTNTNILQPNKHQFIIPDLTSTVFFCQSVGLPTVSANEARQDTPFLNVNRHPDKMIFDPLNISFELDEDMRNYEEIYNWFRATTGSFGYKEYGKNTGHFLYHDIILQIHTNTNNPNFKIKYSNGFPISLTAPRLEQTTNPDTILVAEVSFRFDYFVFDRPNT